MLTFKTNSPRLQTMAMQRILLRQMNQKKRKMIRTFPKFKVTNLKTITKSQKPSTKKKPKRKKTTSLKLSSEKLLLGLSRVQTQQ